MRHLMFAHPDPRSPTIIAKSLYREMKRNGYASADAIALAVELLDLITSDIASRDEESGRS